MKTMNQIKMILTGAGVLFTSVLCAQEGAKDSTLTRTVVCLLYTSDAADD